MRALLYIYFVVFEGKNNTQVNETVYMLSEALVQAFSNGKSPSDLATSNLTFVINRDVNGASAGRIYLDDGESTGDHPEA